MKRALFTAGLLLAATAAQADLTICNTASAKRTVAVAYKDAGDWISKGWWVIAPGSCKDVVKGDLKQQNYYYSLSKQPDFTGDGYTFCTMAKPFNLKDAQGDCAAMGAEGRPFAHLDTGATAVGYTLELTETGAREGEVIEPAAQAEPQSEAEPQAKTAAPGMPEAALQASFEPGSHGEPFTVEALMQGCGETELGDSCTFYAEGVRWIAARGGDANAAALDAMAAMPLNAPVIVVGDINSMGDITVDAAVARIEPGNPDPYASQRALMQGDWVSQDDPKDALRLVGSEETAIYDGQEMAVSVVSFADSCPGGEPIGTVITKQEMGGDPMDLPCFALVDITPDRMELSYVGRGNTLVYLRK